MKHNPHRISCVVQIYELLFSKGPYYLYLFGQNPTKQDSYPIQTLEDCTVPIARLMLIEQGL